MGDRLDFEAREVMRRTAAPRPRVAKRPISAGDVVDGKFGKIYYECTVLEVIHTDWDWVRWADDSASTIPKATIQRKK